MVNASQTSQGMPGAAGGASATSAFCADVYTKACAYVSEHACTHMTDRPELVRVQSFALFRHRILVWFTARAHTHAPRTHARRSQMGKGPANSHLTPLHASLCHDTTHEMHLLSVVRSLNAKGDSVAPAIARCRGPGSCSGGGGDPGRGGGGGTGSGGGGIFHRTWPA